MGVTVLFYSDDLVQLYLGNCRECTPWLACDVLVTDPPYDHQGYQWGQSSACSMTIFQKSSSSSRRRSW